MRMIADNYRLIADPEGIGERERERERVLRWI
jgi:hypothetical protein